MDNEIHLHSALKFVTPYKRHRGEDIAILEQRQLLYEEAKKARCHELIMKLSKGYDTVIGEKGSRISGGEKQRLSIARALLKDAPILILDEATAFIDPENEALIQTAINKLILNKTLVVIAHRISTIIAADEIWVLDKGQTVARGTHDP